MVKLGIGDLGGRIYTWVNTRGVRPMRCLLLDATMRPTTLVTRERAVSLVVCGHAQVIAEEPSVVYRSQHLHVALPVILQVPAYVELRPQYAHRQLSRQNSTRRTTLCFTIGRSSTYAGTCRITGRARRRCCDR